MYQDTQIGTNQWAPSIGIAAASQVDRISVIDDITTRTQSTNSSLWDLLSEVRVHADSLFGPEPTDGKTSNTEPKQGNPARIYGLTASTNATVELAAMLRRQFDRFRAL